MLTKKQQRCQDCICLVGGDNGEWICDELESLCEDIENCPEGVPIEEKEEIK